MQIQAQDTSTESIVWSLAHVELLSAYIRVTKHEFGWLKFLFNLHSNHLLSLGFFFSLQPCALQNVPALFWLDLS